jgi:ribose 5-phosphate isomerase B
MLRLVLHRELKIAVGSDEKTVLTDFVVEELKRRGHAVTLSGPLKGEAMGWPDVGEKVGLEVRDRRADQGILFCWAGTGVTIAANKVPGVRAALCWDAETAKGAHMWDDANVLAMSLRSTSTAVAKEILDAWFSSDPIKTGIDAELIERAKKLDSNSSLLSKLERQPEERQTFSADSYAWCGRLLSLVFRRRDNGERKPSWSFGFSVFGLS